jgi:polysaccharide export outer membrane protein
MLVAVPGAACATEEEFLVGQGDKLSIGVYRRPDLSGEFRVQPDGKLSLPFVGSVPAAGLSLDAVRQAIMQRLREDASLHETRISVEIAEGRPIAVNGAVRQAGVYPFQIGMTVAHAVAAAGGLRTAQLEELAGHVEAGRLRERLRQNRDALGAARIREARLLAERQDADSFVPPDEARPYMSEARWNDVVASETRLLKQRNDVVRSMIAALTNQIEAYRDEAQALSGQAASKARESELLEQEARYIEGLQRQGLTARNTRAIELARLSVQLEGERLQIGSYSAKARQEIARAEHTRTATVDQRQVDVTQALREARDLQQSLAVSLEEIVTVLARVNEALPDAADPATEPAYVVVRSRDGQVLRIPAHGQTTLRPGDLIEVLPPASRPRLAARAPAQ